MESGGCPLAQGPATAWEAPTSIHGSLFSCFTLLVSVGPQRASGSGLRLCTDGETEAQRGKGAGCWQNRAESCVLSKPPLANLIAPRNPCSQICGCRGGGGDGVGPLGIRWASLVSAERSTPRERGDRELGQGGPGARAQPPHRPGSTPLLPFYLGFLCLHRTLCSTPSPDLVHTCAQHVCVCVRVQWL